MGAYSQAIDGGLDLAVESVLDAETVWVSDISEGARAILAHHWPDVPNLGDITTIDWSLVEPIDILTGGFPCQDLSLAGRRAGLTAGTRSGLWSEFLRAIVALRPQLVVIENVRGLLSGCAESNADSDLGPCPRCVDPSGRSAHAPNIRALGRVVGDLANAGYGAAWHGLRAADVGAPHARFRVFILAWLAAHTTGDRWDEGRPEPTRLVGRSDAAERRDADVNLLPTPAASRSGGQRSASPNAPFRPSLDSIGQLLPTPRASDGPGASSHGRSSTDRNLHTLVKNGELLPTPSSADALGGHERRGGTRGEELLLNGMAKAGHLDRFGPYAPAIARWEAVLDRVAPDPTEPTGRGGAHRLAPRFVEWMQGLPAGHVTDPAIWAGWTDSGARNAQLEALGNGVVPQQAAAALRWLLGVCAQAITGEDVAA